MHSRRLWARSRVSAVRSDEPRDFITVSPTAHPAERTRPADEGQATALRSAMANKSLARPCKVFPVGQIACIRRGRSRPGTASRTRVPAASSAVTARTLSTAGPIPPKARRRRRKGTAASRWRQRSPGPRVRERACSCRVCPFVVVSVCPAARATPLHGYGRDGLPGGHEGPLAGEAASDQVGEETFS
jgi:hypothetical protein